VKEASPARSGARLTGVIDTLSAGYGVVNRHPWIVLFPILLDLFLWLGPQYSAARLVSQTLGRGVGGVSGLTVGQQRDLVELFEGVNLLSALAPSLVGVPSLVAALGIRNPLQSIAVTSWGLASAIFFGAVLGGLLLGSLYYASLAASVRGDGFSPFRLLGQTLRASARVVGYLLLLCLLALLFGVPIGVLVWGANAISATLASLVFSAVMVGLIWTLLYLSFVPDAIFISQVGPLRAIRNSVAVVRLGFWSAIGLLGLVALVMLGMSRVWLLASERIAEPWGLGLGILGNAYIASGLLAASMSFYRERVEALRTRGLEPASGSRESDGLPQRPTSAE
jgi:hypothetical protein